MVVFLFFLRMFLVMSLVLYLLTELSGLSLVLNIHFISMGFLFGGSFVSFYVFFFLMVLIFFFTVFFYFFYFIAVLYMIGFLSVKKCK